MFFSGCAVETGCCFQEFYLPLLKTFLETLCLVVKISRRSKGAFCSRFSGLARLILISAIFIYEAFSVFSLIMEILFSGCSSSMREYEMDSIELTLALFYRFICTILLKNEEAPVYGSLVVSEIISNDNNHNINFMPCSLTYLCIHCLAFSMSL